MPTAKEIVENRPLTGTELQTIIRNDFETMLSKQPMLNGIMAFGRVSYEVTLKIHIDNPSHPHHVFMHKSRPATVAEKIESPSKEALEPFPLTGPSDDSLIMATETSHVIQSPNRARVEDGLPVSISVRNQGGHLEEKQVQYPAEQLPPAEIPSRVTRDVSVEVAKEVGLPDLAAELPEDDEMAAFLGKPKDPELPGEYPKQNIINPQPKKKGPVKLVGRKVTG